MIGPTGVGKTEIARRLARLAKAPFIKVEATKFTEVGYVGREVDSIVRDLVDISVKMTREEEIAKVRHRAADAAEERVLDVLLPRAQRASPADARGRATTTPGSASARCCAKASSTTARSKSKCAPLPVGVEIMAPPGMEEMTQQLQGMFQNLGGGRTRSRKLKIKEALKLLVDEEAAKMINEEELKLRAVENAEQNGIVFIDEIDKIARRQETAGADVSREGVQRDLLPLVEGCTVNTKYGTVKTDHVLFIASGAFHMSKPSDLIPELQGRLADPRRARAAGGRGFRAHPDRTGCLAVPPVHGAAGHRRRRRWSSTDSGVRRLAEVAFEVNEKHREHRRAAPAHGHGAAARDRVLRCRRSQRHARRDRPRLRRGQSGRAGQGSGSVAVHSVSVAARTRRSPPTSSCAPRSRILDVRFDDGSRFELPFEYLRVFSPSAEVKGHGGGEGMLQTGKQNVGISGIEPVGNYALRLIFDDGHNTGLYSWALLHELGRDQRRELGALPGALRRGRDVYPARRA